MKKLILCRGVPGSGKSFEANRIHQEALDTGLTSIICSTDSYFMTPDEFGVVAYRFDREKLYGNHKMNQRKSCDEMHKETNIVIIDNTNVNSKDIEFYVESGYLYGYEIECVEPKSPWWLKHRDRLGVCKDRQELGRIAQVFFEKNQHDVPLESIVGMLSRWENEDQFKPEIKEFMRWNL